MAQRYTDHDLALAKDVLLELKNGRILFQFPPKLVTDNRRGIWNDENLRGTEPIAVFSTSGPREMSLQWTYLVDSGKLWNSVVVSSQVRAIRGYFAQVRTNETTRNLVVKFRYGQHTGGDTMTCRVTDISVKHSETLVGTGKNIYPLRTDVAVELRLWTKGGSGEKLQNIPALADKEKAEWY